MNTAYNKIRKKKEKSPESMVLHIRGINNIVEVQ